MGVNTESKLREEVNASKLVIGLITPSSLASYYVMFELGARWGADRFLAPLLAGVKASELSGPSSLLNGLSANSEQQLHQLLDDLSKHLGLPLQNTASYLHNIAAVKAPADAVPGTSTEGTARVAPKPNLEVSFSTEGTPPMQVIKVVANQPISVSRLEYMLSTDAAIAGEELNLEGETLEVPLDQSALTNSLDRRRRQFVFPVHMDNFMQNSTMYRRVVGSKAFYGDAAAL